MIGTALLILLGNGVVAAVLAEPSPRRRTAAGSSSRSAGAWRSWSASFAVAQFSGAHLNPAVTLGFAIAGTIEWSDVPEYFAGEFVGAFIGATLVWLAYLRPLEETEDPGLKLAVLLHGAGDPQHGART